jgi:hypothetical protein
VPNCGARPWFCKGAFMSPVSACWRALANRQAADQTGGSKD